MLYRPFLNSCKLHSFDWNGKTWRQFLAIISFVNHKYVVSSVGSHFMIRAHEISTEFLLGFSGIGAGSIGDTRVTSDFSDNAPLLHRLTLLGLDFEFLISVFFYAVCTYVSTSQQRRRCESKSSLCWLLPMWLSVRSSAEPCEWPWVSPGTARFPATIIQAAIALLKYRWLLLKIKE